MDTLVEWMRAVLASPEFTAIVLTAFTSAVTALVAWAGVVVRRNVLRQLDERELALLRQIAVIVVTYAEQVYKDLDGPARLEKALAAADAYISAYGLKVTTAQLRAAIEAAVYAETTGFNLSSLGVPEPLGPQAPPAP